MRALANRGGGAVAVDLVEVEAPRPAANEALVEVHAASINRGELRLLASRQPGWRPGQDVAGVVTTPAADGSGPPEGSRVVAWVDQAGWAEEVVAPTDRMAVLPDGVSFSEAATLPIAGMTALRALRLGGNLLGKRVLVTGASGGVGGFAVQLAAASGAEVTGVASHQRRDHVLTLGASRAVTSVGEADGPFHLVLESVGGDSLAAALERTSAYGKVVVFGNTSGEPTSFSFRDFSQRPVSVEVFFVYKSLPADFAPDLALLARLVAEGRLRPPLGLEVSWQRAGEALAAVAERRVTGKAVLRIRPEESRG